MQRAGCGDERCRREPRAKEQGQPEQRRQRQNERANEADHGAGDRRRPGDAGNVERRGWRRHAEVEAGEKTKGVGDVARGGGEAAGRAGRHEARPSAMRPQECEDRRRSDRRQSRFDNAPLTNEGARRPHVAAAQ